MAGGKAFHTDGLLVVDKPSGWTSHDVVGKLRGVVGQKRIGHAGTLDPSATGVLLVALGRATRLMRFVAELPKSYVGQIVLGATTSTLDDEGETTQTFDMSDVDLAAVRATASAFLGSIMQVPPMVSALKVDGRRLHELAREGIEVERAARPVHIHALEVEETEEAHVFTLRVSCSSGTYVRSLAADIGSALGGGAHLRRLRRTAIGAFDVDNAVTLSALEEDWRVHLLTPGAMVGHYPRLAISTDQQLAVTHGKSFQPNELKAEGSGPWALVDAESNLVAVYGESDGRLKSLVTLASG